MAILPDKEVPPSAPEKDDYLCRLGEAHALFDAHFAEPDRQARHRRITLIGLRGAGKSTLGHRLARHLDVPFIELDVEIERDLIPT